jgi:3-oxoacyl-[acyl-carrier protein] reductase
VISGRDDARLRSAANQCPARRVIVADVSDTAGATRLVDEARAALGAIDILITNAAVRRPAIFASTPLEEYQRALDLNLLSVVAMCKAAVPAMQERGWGRVVAITSIAVQATHRASDPVRTPHAPAPPVL